MLQILRNVAIVAAGNAAIKTQTASSIWPDDPVFLFSRSCEFLAQDKTTIAPDPNAWIDRVRRTSSGLWLHWVPRNEPDWQLVSFANGGSRWLIEQTSATGGSELWEGRDVFLDDKSEKPWKAVYGQIATDWNRPRQASPPVASAREALQKALQDIIAFAGQEHLTNFEELFSVALQALEERNSIERRYVPPNLDEPWQRLLAAARDAWQFGAMGSWNDRMFDGKREVAFERVSGALYEAICRAVAAAVNSTFPAATRT